MEPQIFDFLKNELNYRLEKHWKIFSWTSTILIGITGGVAAIESKKPSEYVILIWDRVAVTIVILVIAIFAKIWINQSLHIESTLRKEFADQLKSPLLNTLEPKEMRIGYVYVIYGLVIAALLSVWIKAF